jgi:isopentenyldiphosphate isomerase
MTQVHRDGDWHRSVHIWVLNSEKGELLMQKRVAFKDSWPSHWDIGCAGHVSAGDTSIITGIHLIL